MRSFAAHRTATRLIVTLRVTMITQMLLLFLLFLRSKNNNVTIFIKIFGLKRSTSMQGRSPCMQEGVSSMLLKYSILSLLRGTMHARSACKRECIDCNPSGYHGFPKGTNQGLRACMQAL